MTKRLPLFLILLLPVILCMLVWYFWYSPVTTVILVRHAERLNDTDTTSISEAGMQRGVALAHTLSFSGVKRIYVSEKSRTMQTASATAAKFGIVAAEIPAKEISRYADSVKAHRGDVILIVGHSDTIPVILKKLGVPSPTTIHRTEFDDLFVLTLFRFRSTLVRLKYGIPSQLPA